MPSNLVTDEIFKVYIQLVGFLVTWLACVVDTHATSLPCKYIGIELHILTANDLAFESSATISSEA